MVTKVAVPNIFYRYTKNTYNTNSHYHHTKQRTRVTTTTKKQRTLPEQKRITESASFRILGVLSRSRP